MENNEAYITNYLEYIYNSSPVVDLSAIVESVTADDVIIADEVVVENLRDLPESPQEQNTTVVPVVAPPVRTRRRRVTTQKRKPVKKPIRKRRKGEFRSCDRCLARRRRELLKRRAERENNPTLQRTPRAPASIHIGDGSSMAAPITGMDANNGRSRPESVVAPRPATRRGRPRRAAPVQRKRRIPQQPRAKRQTRQVRQRIRKTPAARTERRAAGSSAAAAAPVRRRRRNNNNTPKPQ